MTSLREVKDPLANLTSLRAVVVPVFPLYPIAGFVNRMGEHHWVRVGEAVRGNDRKIIFVRLTPARFFGEAAQLPVRTAPGVSTPR